MPDASAAFADTPGLPEAALPRSGYFLALAVLLGSLVLVLTAWHYARERELRAAQVGFAAKSDEITNLFRQRLVQYELVTRGGASLFASVARPTPKQWYSYVEGMDIGHRFPAIVGLGFAGYLSQSRLPALQVEWKQSGYGLLELNPRGVREFYGPILYLEPKSLENIQAVGFDMYSEPARHQAMQAALDSGQAQLTGAVHLVQDVAADSRGLVLYLPVYRGDERPRSVAARRDSMQGWVYIPFRMNEFVQATLGDGYRDARFRVYDVTDSGEQLLYTSVLGRPEQSPAFQHAISISPYGRSWRVEFDSPPLAAAAPRLRALNNTLALGLFAAMLMSTLAWLLARTEDRAHRMAQRMTEDFRRSEQRFRAALQYSAIGKALLDSEGRIVLANPALSGIVGRDAVALLGERFDTLFEDQQPLVSGSYPFGEADRDGVYRATRRLHREGGIPRHAQLTYSPVPGNIGQDVRGLVQVEDVTERMTAEARVHALNRTLESRVAVRTRELSQANQELEAFAYSVSHDLRAPLRAIDGFSRILVERYADTLDEGGRNYLDRVRKAAGRMGELIDAMLKMSRLTRSELKLERVELSRVVLELLDELQMGDEARQVQRVVAPGLVATGDAALLRNLLSNLLSNAWKFTRGKADASIEFGRADDGEYFVRDNGAGFAQLYVDKLFRPFQRLHNQTDFPGHGIGLASVKRIVERHGGSIRGEAQEGEGATFYFTLAEVDPESDPAAT